MLDDTNSLISWPLAQCFASFDCESTKTSMRTEATKGLVSQCENVDGVAAEACWSVVEQLSDPETAAFARCVLILCAVISLRFPCLPLLWPAGHRTNVSNSRWRRRKRRQRTRTLCKMTASNAVNEYKKVLLDTPIPPPRRTTTPNDSCYSTEHHKRSI